LGQLTLEKLFGNVIQFPLDEVFLGPASMVMEQRDVCPEVSLGLKETFLYRIGRRVGIFAEAELSAIEQRQGCLTQEESQKVLAILQAQGMLMSMVFDRPMAIADSKLCQRSFDQEEIPVASQYSSTDTIPCAALNQTKGSLRQTRPLCNRIACVL
jgi:hypothetical protein